MAPVGGEMSGCKLVSASPTVIAEMLFLDKAGADNVINMFNGKKVGLEFRNYSLRTLTQHRLMEGFCMSTLRREAHRNLSAPLPHRVSLLLSS
jgi:hypothetical protein